jgi:hypothetical protein
VLGSAKYWDDVDLFGRRGAHAVFLGSVHRSGWHPNWHRTGRDSEAQRPTRRPPAYKNAWKLDTKKLGITGRPRCAHILRSVARTITRRAELAGGRVLLVMVDAKLAEVHAGTRPRHAMLLLEVWNPLAPPTAAGLSSTRAERRRALRFEAGPAGGFFLRQRRRSTAWGDCCGIGGGNAGRWRQFRPHAFPRSSSHQTGNSTAINVGKFCHHWSR